MDTAEADARDRADMERLIAGHDAALDELMERHAGPVFRFLARMVANEDDANDLSLQIQSDYEVEGRTGETDDIGQFLGREQKADGAPGAVNRHGWRLSRHWPGVGGRLWKQAIDRVFLQPGRLLSRTHRFGDAEEREA